MGGGVAHTRGLSRGLRFAAGLLVISAGIGFGAEVLGVATGVPFGELPATPRRSAPGCGGVPVIIPWRGR